MKKINYHKIVSPGSSIGYGGIFFMCMTAINHALDKDIELYIQTYNTSYSLNINNWEMVTINQLVDITAKVSGKVVKKIHKMNAPTGVRGRNSNNDLIREKLWFDYSQTLEEGIAKTYAWISEQIAKKNNEN